MPLNTDIVVIGAGPVGSLAAVSFARRGARVMLLEADPRSCGRFAGEWLHPVGVQVLDRLRVGRLEGAAPRTGYGFYVMPDDGSEPIELPYPDGGTSLSAEHSDIVESLRQVAIATPGVDYRPYTRAARIDGQTLYIEDRQRGRSHEVVFGRIVGADGRSSFVRKHIGGGESAVLSYMASVELRDVELPREGFGHLVLGGPGPALLYRIDGERIRVCLDVPLRFGPRARNRGFLWDAFSPVFPQQLIPAFRAALADGPVQWAATRFLSRASYGQGDVALVGDAVGHFHPMTAAGISQGFLDAEAIAATPTLAAYQKHRERQSYVPELLANALYHVFRRDDASAAEIRSAVYRVWRASRFERERTMKILTGAEQRTASFGAAFVRMAVNAVGATVGRGVAGGALRGLPSTLAAYREWAKWPAAALVPRRLRTAYRARSTAEDPIPPLASAFSRHRAAVDDAEAPPRGAHAPPKGDTAAQVDRVLERGIAALHNDIVTLAPRFGAEPNVDLARIAVPIIQAVEVANADPAMAKRMRLGRRRLATQGVRTFLDAHAAETEPAVARELSRLLFVLLDVRSWSDEGIADLDEAMAALLSCQHASGGFGPRPGAAPALRETALVTRALALYRARCRGGRATDVDAARARAARWVRRGQHADGAWRAGAPVTDTADALVALVSAGVPATDASLRRGGRWLISLQTSDGFWVEGATPECYQRATARALHALAAARAPFPNDLDRAAAYLAGALDGAIAGGGDDAELAAPGPREEQRELASAVMIALSRWRTRRAERPADRRKGNGKNTAAAPAPAADSERPTSEDWAFCRAALLDVSRTFSKPIAMLPGDLEVAVSCGYLLCRVADTIEDHPHLELPQRDDLFAIFLDVMERGRDPNDLAKAFETVHGDDPELRLGRSFPRVIRVFRALEPEVVAACTHWVTEMARGMAMYVHRPENQGMVALHTQSDLERYCYFVAGTVGHLLTDLFVHALGDEISTETEALLRRHAEHFGAGLQFVNILKDVTDDRARGWSFIPRAVCRDQGIDIPDLTAPEARDRAHAAVAPLFDTARQFLDDALAYTLAIPSYHKGIRLFCLLPLWMAARTLVRARKNDAMFTAGMPVKITRDEVEEIVAACTRFCDDDEALQKQYDALWQHDARAALRGA